MRFDEACRVKAAQGEAEHRPKGGPFRGDAAAELRDEFIDQANYSHQLLSEGRISEETWRELCRRAEEGWALTFTIPPPEKTTCPDHYQLNRVASCGGI